ncbi:MAG: hypothetical protein HUK18_01620, partial [Bacteroidales bacterium]|nr:hypothetical protein [Bacteroidales bacterium]
FSFKNFNKHIYFNEIERSIVQLYTQNIRALAYKLLQKGEKDKALALINKCLQTFPTNIHSYPLHLADMAIIYSVCGEEEEGVRLLRESLNDFETFMDEYCKGTIRFQSEQRIEAANKISYYLDLCLLSEDWGEERLRVELAESFFSVIKPYLEITYRQKKMMILQNEDFYAQEIEAMDEMIGRIRDFAKVYEEELPEENLK